MSLSSPVERTDYGWRGTFQAMASPCEVLVRGQSAERAAALVTVARGEALRIERKFSRYRDDNIVHALNTAHGAWVAIDDETDRLLDYAHTCWELSGGMFDITSGVLRRAWRFDGSDRVPSASEVEAILPLVGWSRVERKAGKVRMPAGMELDFGGIGKEYAVDRALGLIRQLDASVSALVNFGGDIASTGDGVTPWQIGLENPDQRAAAGRLALRHGALATSGDSRRYLLRDGVRYSHVLNPRTGWPVQGAPRSVTVAAAHCTQAGMLATLALLQGAGAEEFLRAQQVRYWCLRDDHQVEG